MGASPQTLGLAALEVAGGDTNVTIVVFLKYELQVIMLL
jgi:hypothetical protein